MNLVERRCDDVTKLDAISAKLFDLRAYIGTFMKNALEICHIVTPRDARRNADAQDGGEGILFAEGRGEGGSHDRLQIRERVTVPWA